jgi:hypothetical protein
MRVNVCLPVAFMALIPLGFGCSSTNRASQDTLSLAGYESVTLSKITATVSGPYDPEKLADRLSRSLSASLSARRGHNNLTTVAEIEIEIIDFEFPDKLPRFYIGLPKEMTCRLTARDQESGQRLGETIITSRYVLPGRGFFPGGTEGIDISYASIHCGRQAQYDEDWFDRQWPKDILKAIE